MNVIKRIFYIALGASAALTVGSAILCQLFGGAFLVALATTCATTLYHLSMRLAVGFSVRAAFPKTVNHQNLWFRAHKWERPLFKFLRVRKWAKNVPTFNAEDFDTTQKTTAELVHQTCLSETVHELIVALGFASILFCFFFDDPADNILPFLITALAAGIYDLQFVILQRYHRPLLLRHMERERRRKE